MNLPRLSVSRPVFTVMVTLMVLVVGAVGTSRLQIDLLPDVEVPRLNVRATYDGASPEVMERLVTQILEEIVATVPGVEEMSSTSSEGNSRVRVSFAQGTDIDTVVVELQARLEDEVNEFPDEMNRPSINKFDVNTSPVVILGISSVLDPVALTELVETQVRDRFGRVPGVAQVDPWGGFDREVRVELDVGRLQALSLPLDAVIEAIRDANLDLPTGRIEQGRYEVTLRAPAEFADLSAMRSVVVAVRDGAAVTLGQIATVADTYEEPTRRVRVNGQPGLRVAIRKESNANTVEVAEGILAEVERMRADFPQMTIVPVSNQGNFIERSIENVARSVLYGGSLAVLVLLLFLRSVRSTVVVAIAIPICVLATLAVMYVGGLTINLMTLGGLALGVGMMVDNSIVVLENVYRRRQEEGEDAKRAAVRGAGEVAGAIVASTATTLVIFLPLVFLGGVTGLLFTEFAYVVVIALVCSLVVALTLVPVLASRLLDRSDATAGRESSRPDSPSGWRVLTGLFDGAVEAYRDALRWALRRRAVCCVAAVAVLGGSVWLVPWIGSEFLPATDEGQVGVAGEMEIGTRLDLVDRQTRKIEAAVGRLVPEATAKIVSVGASGWRPDSGARGSIDLTLVPAVERERSNQAIADELRSVLVGAVPGMDVRTWAPRGQNVLNRILPGGGGLAVEVRGPELATLEALADRVALEAARVAGVTRADAGRRAGVPQERLTIDRQKAADVGLSVRDVAEALEAAVSGRLAGEYRAASNSYPIRVQLADAKRLPLAEILNLSIETPAGGSVSLKNLVSSEPSRGPVVIDRKDRRRVLEVGLDVGDRDQGSVAADLRERLAGIARPDGYAIEVAGSYVEQREASQALWLSIGLALALVYMVLASQYESLRDPLVVMVSVPMAAVGVLVTLFVTQTTLNVQSYLGCIMLGGIVVNNAILLVDQAGKLRASAGLGPRAAVVEAGRRRLRPILMTSLTTMLGLLPLALGVGEGAEAQAPLARAVIGGLLASMLITLVLVPVVYTLVHPEPERLAAGQSHEAVAA